MVSPEAMVIDELVPLVNTRMRMEFVVLAGPTVITEFGVALDARAPLRATRRVRHQGGAKN